MIMVANSWYMGWTPAIDEFRLSPQALMREFHIRGPHETQVLHQKSSSWCFLICKTPGYRGIQILSASLAEVSGGQPWSHGPSQFFRSSSSFRLPWSLELERSGLDGSTPPEKCESLVIVPWSHGSQYKCENQIPGRLWYVFDSIDDSPKSSTHVGHWIDRWCRNGYERSLSSLCTSGLDLMSIECVGHRWSKKNQWPTHSSCDQQHMQLTFMLCSVCHFRITIQKRRCTTLQACWSSHSIHQPCLFTSF